MTEHGTNIGWTHGSGYRGETWNPVTGCSIVSTECRNCYAEELSLRRGWSQLPWLPEHAAENVVLHPERLDKPLHWREPRMVFVNSMSDLFHEQIPLDFLAQVWDVMVRCPHHVFMVLTKRPERMAAALGPDGIGFYATEGPVPCPQPGIWLGTSIGLRHFVGRADHLRRTPAAVRFISAEPLLGPLVGNEAYVEKITDHFGGELSRAPGVRYDLDLTDVDWLIVGGESGHKHRPMDLRWAQDLRDACRASGTTFFMKQDSGPRPGQRGRIPDDLWVHEWPTDPRVRAATGTTEAVAHATGALF